MSRLEQQQFTMPGCPFFFFPSAGLKSARGLPLSLRAKPHHIPMRGFKSHLRYIIVGIALSLENILADGGKSRETLRP
jgi:hypothetical protein